MSRRSLYKLPDELRVIIIIIIIIITIIIIIIIIKSLFIKR